MTDMLLLKSTLCVPMSAEKSAYDTGSIANQKRLGPFLLRMRKAHTPQCHAALLLFQTACLLGKQVLNSAPDGLLATHVH
jgi:hypothetical protein